MSEEFYRMKRLPPYVIAEVNAMRAAARAAGEDIIDLGMGNPDLPPPDHVIDKLVEVARKPSAHGYSQSRGIPGLRKAQANYYGRRFGVDVDPETEVVVTMGSKEGLASLATAITEPGDVVLAPNPSYPIHTFGFIIAGATIRSVPTTPDETYFRSLDRAMAFTVPRPSILVVNYPSNPTAETVDLAFYERLVAWAKENKVWILSDLAYSELYYDGNPTPSILQVPGAKDVAIEFTSLSKTYSMAGWRMGFAVGNKTLIAAMTRVTSELVAAARHAKVGVEILLNDPKASLAVAHAAGARPGADARGRALRRVIARERLVTARADEYRRKVRIAARAWHTHRYLRPQLRRMAGIDRFKYASRKIVRWFGGAFILLGALAAAILAWRISPLLFGAGLALVAFAVLIGLRARRGPLAALVDMLIAYAATLQGVAKAMRGNTVTIWNPAKSR